jgi:hypothetical protein
MDALPLRIPLLVLVLTACSRAPDASDAPAWPDLQYEPPALVELQQEPLLAGLAPETSSPDSA